MVAHPAAAYRQAARPRSLREWPLAEQPRERLRRLGPSGLAAAELLALVLRDGSPEEDAVALAARLLVEHGGLAPLLHAAHAELASARGMGQAKAASLLAALELGRRALTDGGPAPLQVRCPTDIAPRLMLELGDLDHEVLRLVLLNTKNVVIAMPDAYQGSVNAVPVRAGEIFRHALRHNATALIVAHNHPSGDPTPSPEDVAVTRALVQAGRLLDVEVVDHLVVARRGYVSLKERRLGFEAAL